MVMGYSRPAKCLDQTVELSQGETQEKVKYSLPGSTRCDVLQGDSSRGLFQPAERASESEYVKGRPSQPAFQTRRSVGIENNDGRNFKDLRGTRRNTKSLK